MTIDYKKTLNLPTTGFAMKGNLAQREPEQLKKWQATDLYKQIREISKDSYISQANKIIGKLKNKELQKVVLSRVVNKTDVNKNDGVEIFDQLTRI